MANLFEPDWDPDEPAPAPFTARSASLGAQAGGERLGASLYELQQGESICPLHIHYANEEMIFVIAGRPTLRTLDGERELETGEVVACPAGRAGAHRIDNRRAESARVLIVSTMIAPEVAEYPDSGKVMVRTAPPGRPVGPDGMRKLLPLDAEVDYFEGEVDG
ncbi:MAG: cupin domain-containing protein [Thermoleophilaceae bacterium]|nr:cupin domain-containing protein [Thermoleophilaceae bacterium]